MDTWEYCTVYWKAKFDQRARMVIESHAKIFIRIQIDSTKKVFDLNPDDLLELFGNGPSFLVILKETPLYYLQQHLTSLGKEGWEVIQYRSSDDDHFAEVLLKRKVVKD